jgi:hypothetical protein
VEEDFVRNQIDNSFDEVDLVSLKTSFGEINVVSLSELPLAAMIDFAKTPMDQKTEKILKLLKTCLVDPVDWDKIENEMTTREAMSLIPQWMAKSSEDVDELSFELGNNRSKIDDDEDEDYFD